MFSENVFLKRREKKKKRCSSYAWRSDLEPAWSHHRRSSTGFEVPMIRFGCGVFQDYVGELQALRSEAQVRAGVSVSSARSRITAAPSCYTNKGALWLTWLSTWFLELCSVQPMQLYMATQREGNPKGLWVLFLFFFTVCWMNKYTREEPMTWTIFQWA